MQGGFQRHPFGGTATAERPVGAFPGWGVAASDRHRTWYRDDSNRLLRYRGYLEKPLSGKAVLPAGNGSLGSEKERYTNIYMKLMMGMTDCDDSEV